MSTRTDINAHGKSLYSFSTTFFFCNSLWVKLPLFLEHWAVTWDQFLQRRTASFACVLRVWLWACVWACTYRCLCLFMLVCTCVFRRAHMQGMASGWLETEVLRRKSKMSSSEVCHLFDVGHPLLSASALGRPQHSHTSPYLPLMISLTPILLQLSSNSTPFSTVQLHMAACARVYRNTKCITFLLLSPCVLPNGLHEFCKDLSNWTFMHESQVCAIL